MVDFFRRFGFTRRDLIIISILFISLAAGLIIEKTGWNNDKSFDYTKADAEFEKNLNSSFSNFELDRKKEEKADLIRKYSDSLLDEKENNTPLKNGELPSRKININSASSADLQLLPGIGEITAERIIEYRKQNGNFKSIDLLMNVKGIGTRKFEKLKNLITVDSN